MEFRPWKDRSRSCCRCCAYRKPGACHLRFAPASAAPGSSSLKMQVRTLFANYNRIKHEKLQRWTVGPLLLVLLMRSRCGVMARCRVRTFGSSVPGMCAQVRSSTGQQVVRVAVQSTAPARASLPRTQRATKWSSFHRSSSATARIAARSGTPPL